MDWKGWVVVALVLFFILFGIVLPSFDTIRTPVDENPAAEIIRHIKSSQYRIDYSSYLTNEITLLPESTLRSATIASQSGILDLSENQICISAGDYSEDPRFFESSSGKSILYTGPDNQRVKFSVVCEKGRNMQSLITEFEEQFGVQKEWFTDSCSQVPACAPDSEETCCFIAVRAT
jgi:hypothetical protein